MVNSAPVGHLSTPLSIQVEYGYYSSTDATLCRVRRAGRGVAGAGHRGAVRAAKFSGCAHSPGGAASSHRSPGGACGCRAHRSFAASTSVPGCGRCCGCHSWGKRRGFTRDGGRTDAKCCHGLHSWPSLPAPAAQCTSARALGLRGRPHGRARGVPDIWLALDGRLPP